MREFGLIGNPVAHSQSRAFFMEKFQREQINADYGLYQLDHIEDFVTLCQAHKFTGLNVTAPYKQAIIPYLDCLDHTAQSVGAVNTIRFMPDGHSIGYNTDHIGFRESLRNFLNNHPTLNITQALILGTGGASQAVAAALGDLQISHLFVSRTPMQARAIGYVDVTSDLLRSYPLLINATPLGMHPHENEIPPISKEAYEALTPHHLLYDLVYNPVQTRFLSIGEAHGAQTKNGAEMHRLQALASWTIWNQNQSNLFNQSNLIN